MNAKVSDHVLRRLRAWDIDHVFAHPGEGLEGFAAAWARAGNRPHLVRAGTGATAVLEAVGHARFSGKTGVCAASRAPGPVHPLDGLYDAALARVPVVVLLGRARGDTPDGAGDRASDLLALPEGVAPVRCRTVTAPERVPDVIDEAVRTAREHRGPTAVLVDAEMQERDAAPGWPEPPGCPWSQRPRGTPAAAAGQDLENAAEVLNSGRRVAILVGPDARGAAEEVRRTAETLGAGVAKTLLGKDALSDVLPWVTGTAGPAGTRPSRELLRDCDTLLTIGATAPEDRFPAGCGPGREVRICRAPGPPGARHPHGVDLTGDVRVTLAALLPLLRRTDDRLWQHAVERNAERWRTALERRATAPAHPLDPEHPVHALDPLLPADAVVCADSGPAATWYAHHLRVRGALRGCVVVTRSVAGSVVPCAIGAKFAEPDRPAIALVSDVTGHPDGLTELVTAARCYREWFDPRLVVAVWSGHGTDPAGGGGHTRRGTPGSGRARWLPGASYAEFARSLGLYGTRVEEPGDVRRAWLGALRADRPTVVEFLRERR